MTETATTSTEAATTTTEPVAASVATFDWNAVGLDAETLSVVETKGWQNPNDAITSYRNLEKLTGVPPEQIIKLPKEMNDTTMGEVWDKLGRPKTAAEYNLPIPEGGSKDFADIASNWFHKRGAPASMAQGITQDWNDFVAAEGAKELKTYNDSVSADQLKLKTEWGDKHDSNYAIAKQAATTFGMDATVISSLEKTMGYAQVHRFLYSIGSKLGEAEFVNSGGRPGEFAGTSPESARSHIETMKKDKAFVARFNSQDPVVRGEARAEMARLTQIAFPGVDS